MMSVMKNFNRKTLFLKKEDPQTLSLVTEMAIDFLQQCLACVHHLRDTPVVSNICPIQPLVNLLVIGGFALLRLICPL